MRESFARGSDFTRPFNYMSPVELEQQYRLLESQLRKKNLGGATDTMMIIIQQDGGTDRSIKAFGKVLKALLASPDEMTERRINSFELVTREGSELDTMRHGALSQLRAVALEPAQTDEPGQRQ